MSSGLPLKPPPLVDAPTATPIQPSVTVQPTVTPTVMIPQTPTDWVKIITLVAVSILGTLHIATPTNPPAPNPTTPTVIVNPTPVNPPPFTPPVVTPPVIPPVNPTTPTVPQILPSAITVQDLAGNMIRGAVDSGQMFFVICPTGTSLVGTPQPSVTPITTEYGVSDRYGDVFEASANKLACVLKTGATQLQVVAYGSGKPIITSVACNQAPQPPPIVNPVNPPVVPVNPVQPINPVTPVNPVTPLPASDVRVMTIFDAKGPSLSRDQINAMESPAVLGILNAKCTKDAANRPQWRRWDKDTDVSGETDAWKQLFAATLTEFTKRLSTPDAVKMPIMAIEKGNSLTIGEIDNEAGVLSLLNSTLGS